MTNQFKSLIIRRTASKINYDSLKMSEIIQVNIKILSIGGYQKMAHTKPINKQHLIQNVLAEIIHNGNK